MEFSIPYPGENLFPIKIALIGYGRMGRAIEQVARQRGHEIVARVDPAAEEATSEEIEPAALSAADVIVEFTTPQSAVKNYHALLDLGKPLVSGTTGWTDRLEEVRKRVEKSDASFLYASNFSIGVNLFYRIVESAAHLLERFPQFDPYVLELHHSGKADSPSGTAHQLAKIIMNNFSRKHGIAPENLQRKIKPEELSVASLRAGGAPGNHTVGFEGPFDSITLIHSNRDRKSLAQGVLLGVEWIAQRKGFYEFSDVIDDIISSDE